MKEKMYMPRQARTKSESGYFHLIVRGIGKQILFEERGDYLFFLNRLERYCLEQDVGVCAYCLMENHVHLLVHDGKDHVSLLMKKLGVSYSQYYNRRYKRQGHLFQDRYLSEAVENESYLLMVFRYILNNPWNAGICPAADYEWSSYGLYAHPTKMMELALVRELIGDEEQYRRFVNAANEDVCLEFETPKRGDDWAREKIAERLNAESGSTLQSLDRKGRDAALQQLLEEGLSIRQIERLTGISRGIIQKAKR